MPVPSPPSFSRRSLLLGAGFAGAACFHASGAGSSRLVGARFGKPIRYNRPGHSVIGDTWSCAWSDDDEVYTVIDDTAGFDMVLRPSKDRNVAIGSFGKSFPPELAGRMVNGMETCGRSNQLGADGACWKGNGIASVDGALYLSVSRHWYHVKEYDFRQIARDASILKSVNKGKTWSPLPYSAQPLSDPLFPGPRFATPFFLDAGRDSRAPEGSPQGLDEYVYAVSNDGYWNNGNALHLARVRRVDLPKLELKQWQFYCGYRDDPAVPVWRAGKPGLEACYPILSGPYHFGQTGMNYLAPLGRFLLPSWHYPKLAEGSWNHQMSVWELWEAPAPWGPWRRFAGQVWNTEGFYNPSFPSKFIGADGKTLWALAAGDFNTWDKGLDETLYTLHAIPLTLETEPA
jgi:hypothetical protein